MNTLPELIRRFAKHPSPWLLFGSLIAAIVLRFRAPSPTIFDALVLAAITLYWPIHEWLLHVYSLHAKPKTIGRFTFDSPVAKAHRLHHQDPWNLDHTFIPTSTYVILPAIWAGLLYALPAPLNYTAAVCCFFLSLVYEWMHFIMHTRWVPRSRWYRRLWQNHRLHHFKNENYWFGVTMLSGDVLLRTAPEPEATPVSPTARNLLAD